MRHSGASSNWLTQIEPPPALTAQARSGRSIVAVTGFDFGSIRLTERPSLFAVQTASSPATTFSTHFPHRSLGPRSPIAISATILFVSGIDPHDRIVPVLDHPDAVEPDRDAGRLGHVDVANDLARFQVDADDAIVEERGHPEGLSSEGEHIGERPAPGSN